MPFDPVPTSTPTPSTRQTPGEGDRVVGGAAMVAWAAASAVALGLTNAVKIGLVTQMQDEFNRLVPTINQAFNVRQSPVRVDGLWGRQTSNALAWLIAITKTSSETSILESTGVWDAFDMNNGTAAISTTAGLTNRFSRMRDAVTTYSNTTRGVAQDLAVGASGLLDAVRNAPTSADVRARAQNYLSTFYASGGVAPSTPVAQVVSTRTAPDTKVLQQATQTPSVDPNIIASAAASSGTSLDFTRTGQGATVVGRPWSSRVNLKVLLPSVLVGSLFLVWAVRTYQKRGRK